MTVLEYTPLWQRSENQCEVCTPKFMDLEFSNYYIEEFVFLYIVYEGENYRLTRDTEIDNAAYFSYTDTDKLIAVDEQGDVV